MKKWDIDWAKLGHTEPRVKKTTFPNGPGENSTAVEDGPVKTGMIEIEPKAEKKNDVVALRPDGSGKNENTPKVVNVVKPRAPVVFQSWEDDDEYENDNENSNRQERQMITSKEQLSDTAVGSSTIKREIRSDNSRRTEKLRDDSTKRRGRDLNSGMELLELDFVLGVVENTKSSEKVDITMRKLNFKELMRRQQLHEVDSSALKHYALNENDNYGKELQCEAVKELAERTSSKN